MQLKIVNRILKVPVCGRRIFVPFAKLYPLSPLLPFSYCFISLFYLGCALFCSLCNYFNRFLNSPWIPYMTYQSATFYLIAALNWIKFYTFLSFFYFLSAFFPLLTNRWFPLTNFLPFSPPLLTLLANLYSLAS